MSEDEKKEILVSEDDEGEGAPLGIIIGVVALVFAVIVGTVLMKRQDFALVEAGSESIDFTLPSLSGEEKSLADYKGKVVFLNFWATWCEPCKEEMPSMEAIYRELKPQGFEIVAVSIDKEGAKIVEPFVKEYDITFDILLDRSGKYKEKYKTTGVPETLIIDQNGVVAERVIGQRDWSKVSNLKTVLSLLENGPQTKEAYKSGNVITHSYGTETGGTIY